MKKYMQEMDEGVRNVGMRVCGMSEEGQVAEEYLLDTELAEF